MTKVIQFSSIFLFVAGVAVAPMGEAAIAAESAPAPVIEVSSTATDAARHDWLSEEGRTALVKAMSQRETGELEAFVFAGAPGGNFWAYRSATKGGGPTSIDDLARRALEACEFSTKSPCFIVSINGLDAFDAAGGFPAQPSMLGDQPITFDPERVPFLSQLNRRIVAEYLNEPKAKVLVVTVSGSWLWRAGDNLFEAVATAFADCQETYPNQVCILYAVNHHVVFAMRDPK